MEVLQRGRLLLLPVSCLSYKYDIGVARCAILGYTDFLVVNCYEGTVCDALGNLLYDVCG